VRDFFSSLEPVDYYYGEVTRARAVLGSILFFCVAPGLVVGVGPWLLTRWRMGEPWPAVPIQVLGGLLIASGLAFLLSAFVQFVGEGFGTPAPVATTEHLVVGGIYRHVRNPMYLAVAAAILGQALLLGRPVLLVYAAVILALQYAFVRLHEEPSLRRRFGEQYDTYRRAVPGWWPRPRPWRGTPPATSPRSPAASVR
jgi:protein-S-isoprenylcysteine O-methyltransferase Ste14